MIENVKIYLQEIIDKHKKVSKEPIEYFSICTPVVHFFNMGYNDRHIIIRGVEYELQRKDNFKHSIYVNNTHDYDINIHCLFHNFVPYVGLREKYKYCRCGEKDFD